MDGWLDEHGWVWMKRPWCVTTSSLIRSFFSFLRHRSSSLARCCCSFSTSAAGAESSAAEKPRRLQPSVSHKRRYDSSLWLPPSYVMITPFGYTLPFWCILFLGVLYRDEHLQIGLRSMYQQSFGRLMLYYGNASQSPLNNIQVRMTNDDVIIITSSALMTSSFPILKQTTMTSSFDLIRTSVTSSFVISLISSLQVVFPPHPGLVVQAQEPAAQLGPGLQMNQVIQTHLMTDTRGERMRERERKRENEAEKERERERVRKILREREKWIFSKKKKNMGFNFVFSCCRY